MISSGKFCICKDNRKKLVEMGKNSRLIAEKLFDGKKLAAEALSKIEDALEII